jgi:hypothetical protein
VYEYLKSQFSNVRWLSSDGELPGYDLSYEDQGVRNAVEVKGTTGSYFPAIELTINEWRAAEQLTANFWLYLVCGCETSSPSLEIIKDPFTLFRSGSGSLTPLLFRFELNRVDG